MKDLLASSPQHNARDDVFDLGELLSTLSRKQLEDFWCNLSRKCAAALLHLDEVEDNATCDQRGPAIA